MTFRSAQWESLSADDHPRVLTDPHAEYAVSAKTATTPPYTGWLVLKVNTPVGWTHVAVAADRTVVAQGYGSDEASSFVALRTVLEAREQTQAQTRAPVIDELDFTELAKRATRLRERISAQRREGEPGQRGSISGPQLKTLEALVGRRRLLRRIGISRVEAQAILQTATVPDRPELREGLRKLGRDYVSFAGKTGYAANKFLGEKLLAGAIVLALAEPTALEAE